MKQRNVGIDILRIVSMIFIIIIHLLMQGGTLSAYQNQGLQAGYYFLNIVYVLAYCGVNCFALVSADMWVGKAPSE